jgi:hypothetical protein
VLTFVGRCVLTLPADLACSARFWQLMQLQEAYLRRCLHQRLLTKVPLLLALLLAACWHCVQQLRTCESGWDSCQVG